MSLLRKLFGARSAVPSWAPLFNNDEYEAFVSLVRGYFETRGLEATVGEGVVVVAELGREGRGVQTAL